MPRPRCTAARASSSGSRPADDFEARRGCTGLEAIEVARRQGARFFELRTAALLAAAWHDRGRTDEALALIRPLAEAFPEASDSPDVTAARELIRRLDPDRP